MIIPTHLVIDTILTFLKAERPLYDTIVDTHFNGRKITFFRGIQRQIGEADQPSVEIGPTQDELAWSFVRVQGDTINMEVHITTSNKNVSDAITLESQLVSLTSRILAHPSILRTRIVGTNHWLMDSLVNNVTYGASGFSYNIRVARLNWFGKVLVGYDDRSFPDFLKSNTIEWGSI